MTAMIFVIFVVSFSCWTGDDLVIELTVDLRFFTEATES